ncbi:MAG: hypothetical protein R2688_09590 [Fimbriimonadaceae bacterium]
MLFILLGLGLQTATDGSSPSTPQTMRSTAALVGCILPLLLMALAVKEEMQRQVSWPRYLTQDPKQSSFLPPANPLTLIWDTTTHSVQDSKEDRVNKLKDLASVAPSPRNIRALANAELDAGNSPSALTTVERVFNWDPNNRPGWDLRLKNPHGDGRYS